MDAHRFDVLALALGVATTRRRVLAAALGLAGAGLASGDASAANRICRLRGHKCLRDAQCCTGYCERSTAVRRSQRQRCTCPVDATFCNESCCDAGDICFEAQCCPGDTTVICDGACCNGACVDGVCCPENTTLTCDGQCCAPGEICRQGGCGLPCETLLSGTEVCSWSRELQEYHSCPNSFSGVTSPPPSCSTTAQCRQAVDNNTGFDCDAPGAACFCAIGWRNTTGNGTIGYGACTYGYFTTDGVCTQ